jgi:hypothetical protein
VHDAEHDPVAVPQLLEFVAGQVRSDALTAAQNVGCRAPAVEA